MTLVQLKTNPRARPFYNLGLAILLLASPLALNPEAVAATDKTHENDSRKVYKNKNEDGSISFSDTPQGPDSETLTIKSPDTVPIKIPRFHPTYDPNNEKQRSDNSEVEITITSPAEEETFRNVQQIPIQINVNPSYLSARVDVMHNGVKMSGRTLVNPIRGEHRIQVKAYNTNNDLIGSSGTRTFYVHQHSAK